MKVDVCFKILASQRLDRKDKFKLLDKHCPVIVVVDINHLNTSLRLVYRLIILVFRK